MNTIEIKLVINGKEAIATLQLTDENVQKVAERLNILGQKGTNSIEMLRQKAAMLTQLLENSELGSPQFEELSVMANSAYKELDAAEMTMHKAVGTTGSARMALTSFSQGLSDATMFQHSFRMGLMSIRNNVEQFVMQLGQASVAAKATGQSLTSHLVGALKGPGGIMIGLTAAMALLQVLPSLLEEDEKKIDDFSLATLGGAKSLSTFATAVNNVDQELDDLSVDEIKDKIIELDAQIQLSSERSIRNVQSWTGQLKSFLNMRFGTDFDVTGGEGEQSVLLERSRKLAEEELANRSRVKVIEDEIATLREAQNKKGSDARAIADQIEQKERERENLIKSTNVRLEEQAAITIRIQKAQVDAMQEGYEKQRQTAEVAFNDRKSQLEEELRAGKINQEQYTQLVESEEKKRDNAFRKIEQDKNDFAIKVRTDALKRMSEIESSEAIIRINIDERIALSKNLTEQERLEITRDFAMKRVEAEANAQMAILEIERKALVERRNAAPIGSKERDELTVQIDANDDAFQKLMSDLQNKKYEITIGFKVDSGAIASIDSIAGREAAISKLQQDLAKETSDSQRDSIRKRIREHENALQKMQYSEKQFAQDVYSGAQNLLGQLQQLQAQRIQQNAEQQIGEIEGIRDKQIAELDAKRQEALAHATTSQQKDAINKSYNAQRIKLEQDAEIRSRAVKMDAFNAQKEISRTNALISMAEAILKTMASVPFPFNIPLAALQFAAGMVQIQVINESRPALKDGGIFEGSGKVTGPGGPTDDKVNARLSNGEFVTNADTTKKNLSILDEANRKRISIVETDIIKKYVQNTFDIDISRPGKFAFGGIVRSVSGSKNFRTIPFNISENRLAPNIIQNTQLSNNNISTGSIEKKLDKVVEAIHKIRYVVQIDGKELLLTVKSEENLLSNNSY
jgi:hypothetical protein